MQIQVLYVCYKPVGTHLMIPNLQQDIQPHNLQNVGHPASHILFQKSRWSAARSRSSKGKGGGTVGMPPYCDYSYVWGAY